MRYCTRVLMAITALVISVQVVAQGRYSTGAVDKYTPCNISPNLPLTVPEAANFRAWYDRAGLTVVSRWENSDVWGSDFRDGAGASADLEPQGGSDLPDVYFFTGHGTCQSAPVSTDPDFLLVCSTNGTPNSTSIGQIGRASCRERV